jgi:hypothetical protein
LASPVFFGDVFAELVVGSVEDVLVDERPHALASLGFG